jgi:hypothetical protein
MRPTNTFDFYPSHTSKKGPIPSGPFLLAASAGWPIIQGVLKKLVALHFLKSQRAHVIPAQAGIHVDQ